MKFLKKIFSKKEDLSKEKKSEEESLKENAQEETESKPVNETEQEDTNTSPDIDENEEDDYEEVISQIVEKLDVLKNNLEEKVTNLEAEVEELKKEDEEKQDEVKPLKEKLDKLEKSLKEFASVYEALSAQYNPLIDKPGNQKKEETKEPINNQNFSEQSVETNQENKKTQTEQTKQEKEEIIEEESKEETKKEDLSPQKETQKVLESFNQARMQGPSKQKTQEENEELEKIKKYIESKNKKELEEKTEDHTNQNAASDEFNEPVSEMIGKDTFDSQEEKKIPSNERELLLKKKIISFLIQEKEEHIRNLKAHVDEEKRFKLENGTSFGSLMELVTIIKEDEETFEKHVTKEKDDFANWIDHVLGLRDLANKLRHIKNKHEYLLTILYEL